MNLRQQLLTKNDCFLAGQSLSPSGVMVHSTGADNPWVSRYVPGDKVIGINQYGNHWDRPGLDKCVHAFVGRFADGSIGTVQTLPWTMRGWHAGGYANNSHIGFEICEDGLEDPEYFREVYREAVELTAMLCGMYELDPRKPGVVICHSEGHELGWASNHADVMHWFPKHGKTMDDFRADVAREIQGRDETELTESQVRAVVRDELAKIEAEMANLGPSVWAVDLLAEATEMGLTDGSRPKSVVTREEAAAMARAAALYK